MQNWKKIIVDFLKNHQTLPTKVARVDEDALGLLLLKIFFQNQKTAKISNNCVALVTPTLAGAEKLFASISLWLKILDMQSQINILFLAEESRGKIELAGALNSKIRSLQQLLDGNINIVIGSAYSFTNRTPNVQKFKNSNFTIKTGMKLPFSQFIEQLIEFDYDDELEVQTHGEFAKRGGIVDIFSPEYDYPVRLEFWGDEIDSIRRFDVETQRSVETVNEYRIISKKRPNDEDEEYFSAFDFLNIDSQLVVFEKSKALETFHQFSGIKQSENFEKVIAEKSKNSHYFEFFENENAQALGISPCFVPLANFMNLQENIEGATSSMEFLRKVFFERLEYYANLEYEIVILSNQSDRIDTMRQYCLNHSESLKKFLTFDSGKLNSGVVFPHEKLIVLSENEALTANAFKKKNLARAFKDDDEKTSLVDKKNEDNSSINDFGLTLFEEGDYVVHLVYGIGLFKKLLIVKDTNNFVRELMEIEYSDDQKILIPISQSYQLSRYVGSPGKVRLSRLNSSKWNNDKIAAARAIKDYASQMLRLQAVRNVQKGIEFNVNEVDLKMFLSEFPYTDTPDQSKATLDIKMDMSSNKPMDRLLCGDVGYGKTEVAMRAAFMAVNDNYQVAVLAPTTILVQQHYESFVERFAEYPFIIENISRFKTAKEQQEILQRLEDGKIDIIIGTSALCSSSVKFKKLGLLIIDEEQRFGVKQKEKLREMRTEIDVLAMSATPIPRTLYLSMAGARDLSTLVTPPKERMVVKTMISPINENVIRDAINYEIGRRGQLFYLHNRVKTIESCRDNLAKLTPNCRFAVAHGQMQEKELEQVMNDFQSGKVDCLVASTIIESGLDIPNANTIIIERADRFGLSELYQLRGRVGRWKHQAFAYMLLPENQLISSDGHKRISAIRRCCSLGAGFQLALQDLEIRGSGNLLGLEQSGHLNTIGFELYCQMLKLEIARLKNQQLKFLIDVDINLDFLVLGVSAPKGILAAAFPRDYIESDKLRIEAYRKLASLTTIDEIDSYQAELNDRFGELPKAALYMLKYAIIKLLAAERNFKKVTVQSGFVYLQKDNASYRQDGKLPRISESNPAELKLQQLIQIMKAIKI